MLGGVCLFAKNNKSMSNGKCVCTGCLFACAICRILVYNCYCRIAGRQRGYEQPRPEFNILCLGLQGSGKSTVLAKLAGESTDNLEPTKGFAYKSLLRDDVILQVQEIGGSDKIRPYWNRYFANQNGLIFVFDSTSNSADIEEAKNELQKIMTSSELQHKPVVILCNKQDKPDSKSPQEIEELLELQSLISTEQYIIESCSMVDDDNASSLSSIVWLSETLINSRQ